MATGASRDERDSPATPRLPEPDDMAQADGWWVCPTARIRSGGGAMVLVDESAQAKQIPPANISRADLDRRPGQARSADLRSVEPERLDEFLQLAPVGGSGVG
jgi:hypothetical protein